MHDDSVSTLLCIGRSRYVQISEKEWDALREQEQHHSPGSDSTPFKLSNVSLEVFAGQTIAVVGAVGSGKSSLLAALLGEMSTAQPFAVERAGEVSYAAQTAFIVNGTPSTSPNTSSPRPRSYSHI